MNPNVAKHLGFFVSRLSKLQDLLVDGELSSADYQIKKSEYTTEIVKLQETINAEGGDDKP
jgi:hypothetical protein